MAIDIYGGAGSISGANNFSIDKSPLDQIGFGPGDFPFGDILNLDFLIDILNNLTGLNFGGPGPFFVSLINLIGEIAINIADIVAGVVEQLSNLTGLVFDQGPAAFIDSIISSIANATSIDLGDPSTIFAAIESFFEGLFDQVALTIEQVLVALSGLTGWDWSNGSAAFLQSIFGWLGDVTNLNWTNGPLEWLNSLFALFAAATSLEFVNGPAAFLTSLFNAVFGALDNLTGLDWTNTPEDWLASLWAILGTLTGLDWGDGPITFVQSLLAAVTSATGIDLADPSTIFAAIEQFLTNLTVNLQEVLNIFGSALGFPAPPGFNLGEIQAWISENIFGFIDPNRIPIIPVSHIGDTSPNLLSNPTFTDIAIFDPNTLWTLDPAVSHDNVGGSATTMATPSRQELLSVDLIGVSRGQKIDVSGWVRMAGVAASQPGAVSIGVKTFTTADGSGNATDVVLASVPSYGTADWRQLAGVYEVPDDVMTLRVRLCVDEFTTAGQVWFDDLFAAKQGLLPMSLVQDLIDTVSAIWQGITDAVNAAVEKVEELTGLELNSGPIKFLESLVAALSGTFATIAGAVEWIETNTGLIISQGPIKFLQSLIGLLTGNPTVQLPAASITGVGGFANLGLGVADAIANAGDALGGLTATWTQWQQAFTGRPPDTQATLTPALTATEISELLATTAANATALAALQATVTNGINNLAASGDDFEDGAPLGTRWTKVETGTGGFSVVKGQAVWADAGTAGYERYTRAGADANTITEYQKVTRVTGTTVAEGTLLGAGAGVDYIYGRVSGNNYIYAAFDGDGKVFLGYAVNGVETPFPHPATTAAKPTAGTTYSLECGDIQSPRKYRLLRNNAPVLTYNDAANAAAAVTGKGWGWGGKAVPRFTGQSTPSSVHSVNVVDIPPTPTLGTMLVAVRRNTAKVTKAAGDTTLPPNTFDDVVRTSADISFSQTSNIIVISKEGPYTLSARIDTGTDLTTSEEWELLLYEYVGGVPVVRRRGGQIGGPNTIFQSNAASAMDATFQFYSSGPNRQWAVGFRSTASEGIVGNADGSTTYLTLTRGT